MKSLAITLLLIFTATILGGQVFAQNPKATKAADKKSEVAERTEDRLEKLKEKREGRLEDKKEKIRDKARRKAHIFGEVTAISDSSFTIETKKGDIKTVLTDSETKYLQIGQGGKKEIKFEDVKVGDKIAAVGIAKDESSGVAKFIVKLVRPTVKRHAVFGEVSKLGENQLTISHIIHKDKPTTIVKITDDTKIKIKGVEEASFSDIEKGDKIAASGTVDEDGVITAKRLFVIPGKFEGAEPKSATKSATPSATP